MDTETERIASLALEGGSVERDAALHLALSSPFEDLLYWANEIRSRFRGDVISLCAIASARSGACTEDCAFCAQSAAFATEGNKDVKDLQDGPEPSCLSRASLLGTDAPAHALRPAPELVSAARRAEAAGADAFCIVTSGRGPGKGNRDLQDSQDAGDGPEPSGRSCASLSDASAHSEDFDALLERVRAVREAISIQLHVSVGSLGRDEARALREAGVTSANHNIETSERFYPSICTTHTWKERARGVEVLRDEGLGPCSGGIFGMGETWEDRVEMALALRALGVARVPVNFLNPVPGTPLGKTPVMPAREALRCLAVMRYVLPEADIRTCGGRERVLGQLQSWMFHAGASATMLGDYLTTRGRPAADDLALIEALGLRTRACAPHRL